MEKIKHHFVECSFVNQMNKHVLWPQTAVWRCLVAIPQRIARCGVGRDWTINWWHINKHNIDLRIAYRIASNASRIQPSQTTSFHTWTHKIIIRIIWISISISMWLWHHSQHFIQDLSESEIKKNIISRQNPFLNVHIKLDRGQDTSILCIASSIYYHTIHGQWSHVWTSSIVFWYSHIKWTTLRLRCTREAMCSTQAIILNDK